MMTLDQIFDDDAYDDFDLYNGKVSKPTPPKMKKLKARREIENLKEQKRLKRQIEGYYFD